MQLSSPHKKTPWHRAYLLHRDPDAVCAIQTFYEIDPCTNLFGHRAKRPAKPPLSQYSYLVDGLRKMLQKLFWWQQYTHQNAASNTYWPSFRVIVGDKINDTTRSNLRVCIVRLTSDAHFLRFLTLPSMQDKIKRAGSNCWTRFHILLEICGVEGNEWAPVCVFKTLHTSHSNSKYIW